MKNLLIVGVGGHGKVVGDAACSMGCWDNIAFLDAKHPDIKDVLGYPIIGTVGQASEFLINFSSAVVAIGNNDVRMNIIEELLGKGFSFPVIAHQSACISLSATLGEGSVVFANAVINVDARLGRGCIVNTSAVIEHDCCVGDGVHICPGVSMGGGVKVGDQSMIGIGSSIVHSVELGSYVTVGAGAAVVTDVEAGLTVVGVPAKEIAK